jgi:hypothetical protein
VPRVLLVANNPLLLARFQKALSGAPIQCMLHTAASKDALAVLDSLKWVSAVVSRCPSVTHS